MDNKEPIHIVLCLEKSFIPGFLVVVDSICKTLCEDKIAHFYLIHKKLSQVEIKLISNDLGIRKVHFEFCKFDSNELHNLPLLAHFSVEIYFRLLLSKILPASVGKVVYLDCDLLILKDISELYNIDLTGKALAISDNRNSGVMVLNLDFWRKMDIGNRLISYIRENPEKCPLPDNDAIIHLLIPDHSVFFSCAWNADHSLRNDNFGIVHFVGKTKPWHYNYPENDYKKWFFRSLDNTVMKGWRPNQLSRLLDFMRRLTRRFGL